MLEEQALFSLSLLRFIVESGASCTPVKSTDPDTGGDGAEKDSDATVQLDAGNSQHQKAE